MKGTAYFVKNPSKLSNLVKPHRVEDEVSYEIVRTIYLPQIDYENFATDLTVDRAFIEENAHLCDIHDGVTGRRSGGYTQTSPAQKPEAGR